MMYPRVFLLAFAAFAASAAARSPAQQALKSCDPTESEPEKPKFEFENPETNCKYPSQPYIYDTFSNIATNTSIIFDHIKPTAHFTVMGHHPFAGSYHDVRLVFSNSLWRLYNCLQDLKVDAKVVAIHGGCDQKWSVQEFSFNATTNKGLPWELSSLWVSRWDEDKVIHEVRTYVDAGQIMRTLWDNEIWYNSSTEVEHHDFIPGPNGLPPMAGMSMAGLF